MRRAVLILSGLLSVALGVAVLVSAGLPQRAAYTGYFVPGEALPVAAEIGALAPPIQADTLSDDAVDLWRMRGAPVIVNFWATWCAPCITEMPELQQVYEEHAADGLRIVAVNLGESRRLVAQWADQLGLTFDIVLDPAGDVVRSYPRYGPPATYFIAPDGVISRIEYGPVNAETIRRTIAGWLES
ncbi:MAG: TlpA family protein disulfide reductase [Anaerolineaceae bacterium]|nr:MAG: TlpA family protein disulfide reductase [Anaerolineaceae bacterium]